MNPSRPFILRPVATTLLMGAILLATQRETLQAYDTPTGTLILAIGAVLSFVAYRLMIRIGRLPEDRRVLR